MPERFRSRAFLLRRYTNVLLSYLFLTAACLSRDMCCVNTGEDMGSTFVVCLLFLTTTLLTDTSALAGTSTASDDDVHRKRYLLTSSSHVNSLRDFQL